MQQPDLPGELREVLGGVAVLLRHVRERHAQPLRGERGTCRVSAVQLRAKSSSGGMATVQVIKKFPENGGEECGVLAVETEACSKRACGKICATSLAPTIFIHLSN